MDIQLQPAYQALLGLSALAGAVHVLAPDHWLPTSILAWQRGWSVGRTALFSGLALALHVLLGMFIYFLLDDVFSGLEATRLFAFSVALVSCVMLVRVIRFARVREVLRAGPSSVWGIFAVISLLGPCEAIIPILIKARQLGMGYFTPFVAFSAGSVAAGIGLILTGRFLWNRPLWLPWSLTLARRGGVAVPVMVGLAIGLGAIARV